MKNKILRIFIKLYAILVAVIGFISMLFFFPSPQSCSDVKTCLSYSLCGLAVFIIGIGLFLLNNLARKCMLWFSFVFVGFFIFETVCLIKNDFTGQGLVGLMLVIPLFLICLFGLFFLLLSKIKKEFESYNQAVQMKSNQR